MNTRRTIRLIAWYIKQKMQPQIGDPPNKCSKCKKIIQPQDLTVCDNCCAKYCGDHCYFNAYAEHLPLCWVPCRPIKISRPTGRPTSEQGWTENERGWVDEEYTPPPQQSTPTNAPSNTSNTSDQTLQMLEDNEDQTSEDEDNDLNRARIDPSSQTTPLSLACSQIHDPQDQMTTRQQFRMMTRITRLQSEARKILNTTADQTIDLSSEDDNIDSL